MILNVTASKNVLTDKTDNTTTTWYMLHLASHERPIIISIVITDEQYNQLKQSGLYNISVVFLENGYIERLR